MYSISVKDNNGDVLSIDARDVDWIYEIKDEVDDKDTGQAMVLTVEHEALTFPMTRKDLNSMKEGMKEANPDIQFGAFQGERLPLASLPNTRGLGGLEAGKDLIESKRLIRSGELHKATEEDKTYLTKKMHLKTVIDLRTDLERFAAPDPHMEGVTNIHVPLLHTSAYEKLGLRLATKVGMDEMLEHAPELMMALYETIVTGETGIAGLSEVFRLFLNQKDGSILWHCTQGKDRTGVVAALLEYVLGLNDKQIMDDYLQTNVYLEAEKDAMIDKLERWTGKPATKLENLDFLYEARPEFLEAARNAIIKNYGSMDAYLQMLGVGPEEQKQLRKMYLV